MNEFSFSKAVKDRMTELKYKQKDLERYSEVSQSTISRILSNPDYNTTIRTKNAILKALKLPELKDSSYLDSLIIEHVYHLTDEDKKSLLRQILRYRNIPDSEVKNIFKIFS